MGFLAPWFLGGLLAAALPVYLHLLKQHRSDPVKFSSLMFFERRTETSAKHRRLKYLLLFALRLGVIVLLALLFANPYIRRSATASLGRKTVLLAIDNSFSMRAGNRMTNAKEEAARILSSIGSGDRAQVVSFASGVQNLTGVTASAEEHRSAIAGIQAGDRRSSYGELSRFVRASPRDANARIELHIFSDMQQTSLPSAFAELALPSEIAVRLHPAVQRGEPNRLVESVKAPRSIFQPKGTKVQAIVAASDAPASPVQATLALNGNTLETKTVNVPANGRAAVEFTLNDAPYGWNRGEVRLGLASAGAGKDGLPGDDRYPFAFQRKEASRVLFVAEGRQQRSVGYFRTAIESMPEAGFAMESRTPEQMNGLALERYAFIVLADTASLSEAQGRELAAYVQRGGGLLVTAGPAIAARGRLPIGSARVVDSRYTAREGERFQTAGTVDATHPALARVNRFEAVKFYQISRLEPGQARVVARLADESPLVLDETVGEGRVLTLATNLDNVSNDLPVHASFLPLVEQTALYLSGDEAAPADYPVDSVLELRSAKDSRSSVEVLDPDGKRAFSLKEAAAMNAFRIDREGYYEVRRGNGRNEVVAAHADRRESQLGLIPAETQALWQKAGASSGPGGTGQNEEPLPYSLWWYFTLALAIVCLAESLIAAQYLRARGTAVSAAPDKVAA